MISTILNTGASMPLLGLGVYDMYEQEAIDATLCALETGYRLLDTASMYNNETEIGKAVKLSGIKREEIFITTKVNNTDQGFDNTLKSYEKSLKLLGLEYVDLYLIHWPIKSTRRETWKALEYLYEQKMVKAIGVANYLEPFLDELETYANVVPAVNQVEFSPFLNLENLRNKCEKDGTILQAYTPLIRGARFGNPTILSISKKYQKTEAQIYIRWALQKGVSTIPKSANPIRIKENFDVFDFEINDEDMITLNGLNEDFRVVDDPMELI